MIIITVLINVVLALQLSHNKSRLSKARAGFHTICTYYKNGYFIKDFPTPLSKSLEAVAVTWQTLIIN